MAETPTDIMYLKTETGLTLCQGILTGIMVIRIETDLTLCLEIILTPNVTHVENFIGADVGILMVIIQAMCALILHPEILVTGTMGTADLIITTMAVIKVGTILMIEIKRLTITGGEVDQMLDFKLTTEPFPTKMAGIILHTGETKKACCQKCSN
jgi:hypothetical protein